MRWTVVIPVKTLPSAKSRLVAATADAAAHRRLVEAVRADTAAAAAGSPGVARVLFVSDRAVDELPGGVDTVVQSSPGLNGALADAAAHAAATWPADGVVALVGDLPALRAEHLAAALTEAAGHVAAFVADLDGTGTTMLTAAPGHRLRPAFGPGSAARHAAFAHPLDAASTLRSDVDTAADLDAARLLGLGPRTDALLQASPPAVHLDTR